MKKAVIFKRRRAQRTDYRQRLALLRSGTPRMIVRRHLKNFQIQIIGYDEAGDKVSLEVSSKMLTRFGWLGHPGNTSAAYLTGYLAGAKALSLKISRAILDLGVQTSVKGSSVYAAALGAKHAGLDIPIGEIMPGQDRIKGEHVAKYAALLKKDDKEKYKKQFSSYLKKNLEPEKLPEHFEEVKKKIFESAKGE